MGIRQNKAPLKIIVGVAAFLLPWAPAQAASPLSQLTTAQQVRVLSPDEANRGYPVRLRAVVTYCDPVNLDFFVQDASAGIYINDPNLKVALRPGDLLDIEGVTEDIDFAPQVGKPRYRVIGQAPLPKPKPADYDALISTREDSQWVQFEGIVRSGSLSQGRITLDIVGGGGHLKAYILNGAGLDPAKLIDAKVRLQGVSVGIFNQQGQLIGVQLDAPGLNQLQIPEAPFADPFALPLRALKDVMIFTPQGTAEHRIRVQGTVTLRRARGFFIQDGTHGLYVPGVRQETLVPGEHVDVVGFADIGEYTPVLQEAIVRDAGSHSPLPTPVAVTAQQALVGSFDTLRVRLEATLRDLMNSETDRLFVLEDGGVLFEARIDQSRAPQGWPHLPPGSRVRLTGVCSVNVNRDRVPTTFAVLLDSPADLVVLARPSWWTLRNTLAGLAALAVVTLAVLAWVAVLRRQVRQARERARVLFSAIPHPAYVFDLETLDFVEVNDIAVKHYEYSREEFLSMKAAEIHPPEEVDRLKEHLLQVRSGRDASGEWKHRTKDGRLLDVEITFQTVDLKGRKAALTVAEDITERKRAEEALRHRTVELERSNADLEQFAYVASHDLQEPLRMVTNFSQLLAMRYQGRLGQDADEFIGFAVEGATRMRALIDGLLSFARVKSRAAELTATDSETVFSRCLANAHLAIRQAHAHVTHDPLPSVLGDGMQLEQVFQNLLSNALKFRGKSRPRVHVSAQWTGSEWTFSVKDNGIGIDPAYFDRIFVIFQRLHTRQAYPGAGIGLSICKRIIERHGGRIWVGSAEGEGTTFYFTLPAVSSAQCDGRGLAITAGVSSD